MTVLALVGCHGCGMKPGHFETPARTAFSINIASHLNRRLLGGEATSLTATDILPTIDERLDVPLGPSDTSRSP